MTYELTGRTRYRNGFWPRSKPVLQVEYESWEYSNLGYCVDCERVARWRDATPADYLNCTSIAIAKAIA